MHTMCTIVYRCSANQPLKRLIDLAWPNYSLLWHCVNFRVEITATLLNHSSHDNCSDDEDGPQIPKHYKPAVSLGRQPSLETYVLGPELQFYVNGRVCPCGRSIFHLGTRSPWEAPPSTDFPQDSLPQVTAPLSNLLRGVCEILGQMPSAGYSCWVGYSHNHIVTWKVNCKRTCFIS